MKIWKVDFKPMWPVGGCLIIAAPDYETAAAMEYNMGSKEGLVFAKHIKKIKA